MRGKAALDQDAIRRLANVGQRVEQGAIQIKYDRRVVHRAASFLSKGFRSSRSPAFPKKPGFSSAS